MAGLTGSTLEVTISGREDLGGTALLYAELDVAPVRSAQVADAIADADAAGLQQLGAATTRFIAQVAPSSPLQAGDTAVLQLPAAALHLFDLRSGARLDAAPIAALATR